MSYENANIETIARGVLVRDGQLLVCLPKKGGRCYLPGGHIEFGETARQALVREIKEEMGRDATATRFLAATENSFLQGDERHCEINLLFALEINDITPAAHPEATEDWIAFRWVDFTPEALTAANLLPAHLITDLPRMLTGACPHTEALLDATP